MRWLGCFAVASFIGLSSLTGVRAQSPPTCACLPSQAATAAAFDLAGVGRLGRGYPHLPRIGVDSAIVPPTLLKAIGWVESNWRQFTAAGVPLLSYDYGYGIMQITSGMAGAFGDPVGSLSMPTQAHVGGDYIFNIAYGARMLAQDFLAAPAIGHRDPTVLEDWYYAVWAYNGWGWINNPNNPIYSYEGNPGQDPENFPYQYRVYYWVQHPPLDASGHPLWPPMKVSLPSRHKIGDNPHAIRLRHVHHEIPHIYGATYDVPSGLTEMRSGRAAVVHVRVYNTSGVPWKPSGSPAFGLMYHWVHSADRGNPRFDPHLGGIDLFDGSPTMIHRNVPVGGSIRLRVRVQAPSLTGNLTLAWDMVGRSPGWFSYNGVPPGFQGIHVVSPSDAIPPYKDPGPPRYFSRPHDWFVTLTSAPVASVLTPGEPYSETVLLFNPGGTAWGSRYRLQLLGKRQAVALPVSHLAPCRILPVTISGNAPRRVGGHDLRWRMVGPNGRPFGATIHVRFKVVKQGSKRLRRARILSIA